MCQDNNNTNSKKGKHLEYSEQDNDMKKFF